MTDDLRSIITDVATGAGESADALRRSGIAVELQGYTIEVVVDPGDPAPAATVTLTFGSPATPVPT
jgi:hypothetical protein